MVRGVKSPANHLRAFVTEPKFATPRNKSISTAPMPIIHFEYCFKKFNAFSFLLFIYTLLLKSFGNKKPFYEVMLLHRKVKVKGKQVLLLILFNHNIGEKGFFVVIKLCKTVISFNYGLY